MNKNKLEFKLKALVTVCRASKSKEAEANYIMECVDDILKAYAQTKGEFFDTVLKNTVKGSLNCPECGAKLQFEIREATNSDLLNALKDTP